MKTLQKIKRRIQFAFLPYGKDKIAWLVRNCMIDMFNKAGGDFDELVANAEVDVHGVKHIPFMDYSIPKKEYDAIFSFYESLLKTKRDKYAFSFHVHLGCSPKCV